MRHYKLLGFLVMVAVTVIWSGSIPVIAVGNDDVNVEVVIDYRADDEDVKDSDYWHVPNVRLMDGDSIVYETGDMNNGDQKTVSLPKIQSGYTVAILRTFTDKKNGKVYQEESKDYTIGEIGSGDRSLVHVGMTSEPRNLEESIIVESKAAEGNNSSQRTAIPIGIVIGGAVLLGAGGALAQKSRKKDKSKLESDKHYEMVFDKNGSDKLRMGEKPTVVWGRIVEMQDGQEIPRPDLSQNIRIKNEDGRILVSDNVFDGSSMTASIEANQKGSASSRIIMDYSGIGGHFSNHILFQVVGDPLIKVQEDAYVLCGCGAQVSYDIELVDFLVKPEVQISLLDVTEDLEVKLEEKSDGKLKLVIKEQGTEDVVTTFYDDYRVQIVGQNGKEYAETTMTIHVCHEGVLVDFMGKEPVVEGNRDQEGAIKKTLIAFRASIWEEAKQELLIGTPENLQVEYKDDNKVFENLGISYEISELALENGLIYEFTVERCLPSLKNVPGTMTYSCDFMDKSYHNKQMVEMVPDPQEEQLSLKVEYEKCRYIIHEYLPESFQKKKLDSLEVLSQKAQSPKDLYNFRQTIWQIASRAILQEQESYMKDAYWYDEVIDQASVVVDIGNIAFDIALAPFGGPITGFVVSEIKDGGLELMDLWLTKPSFGYKEAKEFVSHRLIQGVGMADGLVEMPDLTKPSNYKKFAIWISAYCLYRFSYHLEFDKEDGNSIGVIEAFKRAVYDMAGKSASSMMNGQIKKFVEHYKVKSIADADQALLNKGMTTAMDVADDVAKKADHMLDRFIAELMEFIEKIKSMEIVM